MSLVKRQKVLPISEPVTLEEGLLLQAEGAVLCSRFSPSGEFIASAGTDKMVTIWDFPDPKKPTHFANLKGHKSAVTSVRWTRDGESVVSASTDKTAGLWDVSTSLKTRKFAGHKMAVNDVCCQTDLGLTDVISTVSDDGTMCLWDPREKSCVMKVQTEYPLMCVEGSDNTVFFSGVEALIYAYDIRNNTEPLFLIETLHQDSVTSLSKDMDVLISGAMDGTIRAYNCAENYTGNRTKRTILEDAPCGEQYQLIRSRIFHREDYSRQLVIAGSEDATVTIWDFKSEKVLGKVPGHNNTVVDVDIHPYDSIILSSSIDNTLMVKKFA